MKLQTEPASKYVDFYIENGFIKRIGILSA